MMHFAGWWLITRLQVPSGLFSADTSRKMTQTLEPYAVVEFPSSKLLRQSSEQGPMKKPGTG
jgi:hypothetical protein